ncbi:hypothetical protein F5148DRAFT_1366902 [Russula earlei]|uniref:Uncharacterized protein n=1 Tax=Russula earlei TaxID=71964 RepID=A0ACC0UDR0_9AGAM|nr:hypothetical protein F5148DRAFT_1366902 [Russula earlei]
MVDSRPTPTPSCNQRTSRIGTFRRRAPAPKSHLASISLSVACFTVYGVLFFKLAAPLRPAKAISVYLISRMMTQIKNAGGARRRSRTYLSYSTRSISFGGGGGVIALM